MREVNLSGVDLNLLPVLDALLRRRNVTAAAAEAGLSQPAASRALQRLREVLDDPLLIRAPGGYVLSPKARELAPRLAQALEAVGCLYAAPAFDPATAERTVRLAAADTHTLLLIPPLMARLAAEAPGVRVAAEPYGPDLAARIERGGLDMAFAVGSTPLPPGALSLSLGWDDLVLVMRRDHPLANTPWTVETYGEVGHVAVALVGDGSFEIDGRLALAGVQRRIALTTPHFAAAMATAAATDLVTTISRAFASRLAPLHDVVLRPPPLSDTAFEMTVVWSHTQAADPLLTWFRGALREVAAEVFAVR